MASTFVDCTYSSNSSLIGGHASLSSPLGSSGACCHIRPGVRKPPGEIEWSELGPHGEAAATSLEDMVDQMPLHWPPPPQRGVPDTVKQRNEILAWLRRAVARSAMRVPSPSQN